MSFSIYTKLQQLHFTICKNILLFKSQFDKNYKRFEVLLIPKLPNWNNCFNQARTTESQLEKEPWKSFSDQVPVPESDADSEYEPSWPSLNPCTSRAPGSHHPSPPHSQWWSRLQDWPDALLSHIQKGFLLPPIMLFLETLSKSNVFSCPLKKKKRKEGANSYSWSP